MAVVELAPVYLRQCLLSIDNLELKRRLTYVCRCDERLKVKTEGSTRLVDTWFLGGLEHLKIETRLTNEMFCECDT